ncbi:hypothetical protein Tsubulata_033993 [Turnera subulata]|uniref:Endonuclease/exonuclease/phosphatase domain-containing protein n=1 Tax=Turnera subulata TaxID=218843 RepID=A0A9Q0GCG1_9ROSI|nr:hypothetical protein Tsubulata_033993 [Turnera subulata]
MMLLDWNCQGIGRSLTVKALRGLLVQYGPSVMFLIETQNRGSKVERLRRMFRFPNAFYVDAIGKAGGLALWWDESTSVEVLSSSFSFIDTCITLIEKDVRRFSTFIYGLPVRKGRVELWEEISSLRPSTSAIWFLVGDLNTILSEDEKEGGRSTYRKDIEDFNAFVYHNGLLDLGFKGLTYTWSNQRMGEEEVKEKLDRA